MKRNASKSGAMAVKDTLGDRIFNIVNLVMLGAVALVVLYPLYFVVIASFTDPNIVNSGTLLLYPVKFYAKGYEKIFAYSQLWVGYRNSLVYMVLGTSVNLIVTIPGAYALSRKDFVGRGPLLKIFAFTMFFSGGLIPSYIINSSLGLRNNLWAMILPGALSVWNMLIARTFFESTIPGELLDAAHIDGCSDFRFFFQIALPLSKALLAVITLYYAVGHWNGYFHALIYLNKESQFPLQLVLRNLLIINQVSTMAGGAEMMDMAERLKLVEQLKYGIIVVSSLPLMILYPFLQRFFTKGVLVGSIKG
ncbi:MAG: carbohydrate ABC transporter permease [Candidatus Ventricola sp.]